MKTLTNFLSGLLALTLLVAMGLGLYYLLVWIVDNFRGLDPQQAPILTAVFFALVLLALLVRWSRNQDSETRLRLEKAEVYRRFLSAWSSVLQNPEVNRAAEADLKMAEQALLLWSNSGILRAYSAVRELREIPQTQAEIGAVEKVVKAIRADVKQQTFGLDEGVLVGLLLTGAAITETTRSEIVPESLNSNQSSK